MIKVTEDYFIDADESQYILKKDMHRKDKNGNDIYSNLAYCGTIKRCLERLCEILNRKDIEAKDMTLSEAIKMFNDRNKEFAELMSGIKEVL